MRSKGRKGYKVCPNFSCEGETNREQQDKIEIRKVSLEATVERGAHSDKQSNHVIKSASHDALKPLSVAPGLEKATQESNCSIIQENSSSNQADLENDSWMRMDKIEIYTPQGDKCVNP